jgi:hypothetical protein
MDTPNPIWPNFYIVGGVKSGTTSLWAYLKDHPQVFLPKVKEPRYFGDVPSLRKAALLETDLAAYQSLYRGAEGFAAIGDCSPQYLEDPLAAGRIHEVSPSARIIIILRDPVDRAYAQYLMPASPGVEVIPFADALRRDWGMGANGKVSSIGNGSPKARSGDQRGSARLLELPLFHDGVERYLKLFGDEQVAVFLFEDLKRSPEGLLLGIARHIGIDPAGISATPITEVHNHYKRPRFEKAYELAKSLMSADTRQKVIPYPVRKWLNSSSLLYEKSKPTMSEEARRFLQNYYEADVAGLEHLLKRDFSELRKSWI